MSDDFDSRLDKELRRLADAVPVNAAIRPVARAHVVQPVGDASAWPLTAQVRVRRGLPAGLAAAAVALVLVVIAGAGLYGGSRSGGHVGASGSPTEPPTIGPDRSAVADLGWLTVLAPKDVATFGADSVTAAVLGPEGGAAYVIDDTANVVYRVDLRTGSKLPVLTSGQSAPGPDGKTYVAGKPHLLATGGGDVLILDDVNNLWRWHPAVGDTTGRGVLAKVNIPDSVVWGDNVRAIGTFVINSQLHSYNVYVVSPSEWQVIKYSPAVDGSGYPSAARVNYLSVSTDLSSVDDLYVDGKIYLVDKGKITRYVLGQAVLAWATAQPPGSGTEKPFYTRLTADNSAQDQGTFYAYDSANRRIVAFSKSGAFIAQFIAPSDTAWFSALTGMFVTTGAKGANPTIYWTEGGNLMTASLAAAARPVSSATPVPSASGSSGLGTTYFTYGVTSGDTLAVIAQRFMVREGDIRALNPHITDWGNLLPGTILNIPMGATVTPTEAAPNTFQYRVIGGDTVKIIANRFAVSVASIEWANPQMKNDQIQIGETLNIPLPNFRTPTPAVPASP